MMSGFAPRLCPLIATFALAGCQTTESVRVHNNSSHILQIADTAVKPCAVYELRPGGEFTAAFGRRSVWWINEHYVTLETAMLDDAGRPTHICTHYILGDGPHTFTISESTEPWKLLVVRSDTSWLSAPPSCLSEGERARVAPGVEW